MPGCITQSAGPQALLAVVHVSPVLEGYWTPVTQRFPRHTESSWHLGPEALAVTKTHRVVVVPSPRAGLLAESWRRAELSRRLGPEALAGSSRHAGWLWRPAPERGRWRSDGDTLSSHGVRALEPWLGHEDTPGGRRT